MDRRAVRTSLELDYPQPLASPARAVHTERHTFLIFVRCALTLPFRLFGMGNDEASRGNMANRHRTVRP